jgi:hypothetical protein
MRLGSSRLARFSSRATNPSALNADSCSRNLQAPAFLITIDTEGDNLWSRPRRPTTRNASYLDRFQELCERYRQRPTWLTNYEMIMTPTFRRFAVDVIARRTAEIGMHLHAWDTPPLEPLTPNDAEAHPFLIEYPAPLMREKIHGLTANLEDTLGIKMVSHRAGRWSFDERYVEMLLAEGYRVDCSVTPLVNWATTLGAPDGRGGTDYTQFPHEPYWLDLADISQPGKSDMLEVPVTILPARPAVVDRLVRAAERLPHELGHLPRSAHRAADRFFPKAVWLRPTGDNRQRLLDVVGRVVAEQLPHAEFMLHSSELMPGGSPTFPDEAAIEALYGDLEALFEWIQHRFRAATLSEFHMQMLGSRG